MKLEALDLSYFLGINYFSDDDFQNMFVYQPTFTMLELKKHYERHYDVLKSKSPYFLSSKNINFNKNEAESQTENAPPTLGVKETFCFSLSKNRKLKVKLSIDCLLVYKNKYCLKCFYSIVP